MACKSPNQKCIHYLQGKQHVSWSSGTIMSLVDWASHPAPWNQPFRYLAQTASISDNKGLWQTKKMFGDEFSFIGPTDRCSEAVMIIGCKFAEKAKKLNFYCIYLFYYTHTHTHT